MSDQPEITVHVLPPSHPCATVRAALEHKGLTYDWVEMDMTGHNEGMEKIYGEGQKTVPGAVIDGEAVHGSVAILRRLEELQAPPPLYPETNGDSVREAEEWGAGGLQDLGRRLPWGALHFRPEAFGILGGAGLLDPAGTDYAIRFIRAGWKYHGISAVQLASDLAGLPEKLAHIDSLVSDGVLGGEEPNAADLQIGATIRVLQSVGDLGPLLEGTAAAGISERFFRQRDSKIPAGAFPAGWVPSA
ncbi:hypothetical protein BH10ACT11_BH10ACT11_07110 [soil metagenome]